MATYRIEVEIDPTGASTGARVVKDELAGVSKAADTTKDAVQFAFDFNAGPFVAKAGIVDQQLETIGTAATQAATVTETVMSAASSSVEASMTSAATASKAALNSVASTADKAANNIVNSGKKVQASNKAQQAGFQQLGFQINDFSTQVLTGINPLVAFTQQSGQAAFALSQFGGKVGAVGTFLAGPWGALVLVGITVLGQLAAKLFDAGDAADTMSEKQNQLANFVSFTTGKINEQTVAVQRLAAAQARQDAADKARKTIASQGAVIQGAVSAASNPANVGNPGGFLSPGPTAAQRAYLETGQELDKLTAKYKSGILDANAYGLAVLKATDGKAGYDDLRKTIVKATGAVSDSTQAIKKYDAEQRLLLGTATEADKALIGLSDAGASAVERQVALANATTPLARAQENLRQVQERGREELRAGTTTQAAYRAQLDVAPKSVNAASAAQKALSAGRAAERKAEAAARAAEKKDEREAEVFRLLAAEGALSNLYGVQRAVREKQLSLERTLHRELTPDEDKLVDATIRHNDALQRQTSILEGINKPVEDYKDQIAALVTLLLNGTIQLDAFNQASRNLALPKSIAGLDASLTGTKDQSQSQKQALQDQEADRLIIVQQGLDAGILKEQDANRRKLEIHEQYLRDLKDLDQKLGAGLAGVDASLDNTSFQRDAELEALRQDAAARIQIVKDAVTQQVTTEQGGADRIAAIHADLAKKLNDIDTKRKSLALQSATDLFGSLADAVGTFAGKSSAAYKALFAVSKAFAIADSIVKIQQGIASALSLPFPANIAAAAAVAAEAASIVSNIQAVTLAFANGGRVPGSGPTDSVLAKVTPGEYVVNPAATAANLPLLEAINSGRSVKTSGGQGVGAAIAGLKVTINNQAGGVQHDVRQISETEVEVIARRIVASDAPRVIAADMSNPNSRTAKATGRAFAVQPKRN